MNRLTGADGVRAIACLMVMTHHAWQRIAPWALDRGSGELQKFFLTGAVGVAVFFVLSGFLLSEPFWRAWVQEEKSPSLRTFAVRRWARIAPAFWLNIVIVFALGLVLVPQVPDRLLRFLAGISFTSSLTWQTFFPVEINLPLWSIGYEVLSYFLLGAAALMWFKLPIPRHVLTGVAYWLGILAAALAIHVLLLAVGQTDAAGKGWEFGPYGGAKYWWPNYNPIGFFAIFVLGILAAGASTGLSRWLAGFREPYRLPFDIAVLIALWFAFITLWEQRAAPDFADSFPTMPYYFPAFPLAVAAILALAPHTASIGPRLDNKYFRFIATISYGLYIWHYALLELARLTIWPDFGTYGLTDAGDWFWRIVAIYALSFVLATLSWYLFEKRIVAWSRNWGRGTVPQKVEVEPLPAPGAATLS